MRAVPAVVAVSDHRGWAVFVTVAALKGRPRVVDRRRVELVDEGLSSQPYHHHDPELPLAEAAKLISRVEQSVNTHAMASLQGLARDLAPSHRLVALGMEEGARTPLPASVAERLASQTASIAADGAIYREAFVAAVSELGLASISHARGTELQRATEALRIDDGALLDLLKAMGQEIGPPWRKEHRIAAASAIAVLGEHVKLRVAPDSSE